MNSGINLSNGQMDKVESEPQKEKKKRKTPCTMLCKSTPATKTALSVRRLFLTGLREESTLQLSSNRRNAGKNQEEILQFNEEKCGANTTQYVAETILMQQIVNNEIGAHFLLYLYMILLLLWLCPFSCVYGCLNYLLLLFYFFFCCRLHSSCLCFYPFSAIVHLVLIGSTWSSCFYLSTFHFLCTCLSRCYIQLVFQCFWPLSFCRYYCFWVVFFFSTQFWLLPILDPLPQLDWFLVLILGWFMTASFLLLNKWLCWTCSACGVCFWVQHLFPGVSGTNPDIHIWGKKKKQLDCIEQSVWAKAASVHIINHHRWSVAKLL